MKFELFKDVKKEWRWRLRADNEAVIADGAEGYKNKADAVNGINLVKSSTTSTVVWEQKDDLTWFKH